MSKLPLPGSDGLTPGFEILIGDRPLSALAVSCVVAVEVSEDIDAVGMFTLELNNWNLETQKVYWADGNQDDPFSLGSEVKIKLGYGSNRSLFKTLMIGEITGLEPEFVAAEMPRMIVRGHDFSHRLMRGTKTRSFTRMTDSAIVTQVAKAAKLELNVSHTPETLDYVLQRNQTDLAFIRDRAARIGYEVLVVGTTLVYRPLQPQGKAVLTLGRKDLLEFSPRLSTLGQVDEVEVRGWNAQQKEPAVVGKASSRKVNAMAAMSGIDTTKQEFGNASSKTIYAVIDQTTSTPQEAQAIAQGQMNRMALSYITGEGACQGYPDLRAGQVIELTGLGQWFSGDYYVTATTHRYAVGEGYRTEFNVRRNAT